MTSWRFDFVPVPDAPALSYAVAGDVLTVGGTSYDLGPLGEGDSLPSAALPEAAPWLRSEVTRWGGVLRLCVVMPFDATAKLSRRARHPDALDVTKDGPVALPTGAAGATEPGTPAGIDWTQKATASGRALAAWRASASLPVVDFAVAALGAGLLTAFEAEGWVARDTLPAVVEAALATLPEAERTPARLRALGSATVHRMHPLIALLAARMGLSDAQVDQLFGGP